MRLNLSPKVKVAATLACASLFVAGGCGKPSAQQTGQMPPPEVNVVTVQPRDIAATFEQVGQTAGVREVEVRPRVTGILQRWNYKEGSAVPAGRSLFTIDPAPFQATVARVDADLASAQAKEAQAGRDIERLQPLYEQGMVSRKAYDDALSAKEVAAAGVKSADAALRQAKLDLAYTRVEAPISGVTSRALKSEGSLVEAQQTLLTTISQVDPIHVIFSISESENLKLQRESGAGRLQLPKDGRFTVTVKLSDGTTYARPGRVDFSDVRINPQTGTSEARAVLPNSDQSLRPGQFVRVTLAGATYMNALAVPQRAVLEGPSGKIVMTVNAQGMVEPRPVEVGQWAGEDWIITSGLNPGDRVIVDGIMNMRVRPGSPVKVAEAKPPAPAQATQPAAKQQ
jgi:membrane fusion protein, multidrug efflux system